MNTIRISAVVALSKKRRAIGNKGELLWNLSSDMKRFKTITSDHVVVMGRKTWESIPEKFRPLPNRTNIVVTRNLTYRADGAIICHGVKEALEKAEKEERKQTNNKAREIFIIGGEEIYREALPNITRLYVTCVDNEPTADTFFPDYSQFDKTISQECFEENNLPYCFLTLDR